MKAFHMKRGKSMYPSPDQQTIEQNKIEYAVLSPLAEKISEINGVPKFVLCKPRVTQNDWLVNLYFPAYETTKPKPTGYILPAKEQVFEDFLTCGIIIRDQDYPSGAQWTYGVSSIGIIHLNELANSIFPL
jgi:hypothetical protein